MKGLVGASGSGTPQNKGFLPQTSLPETALAATLVASRAVRNLRAVNPAFGLRIPFTLIATCFCPSRRM
jgi:hypothetical protein